jgi:leucyl/phenylalanyl-tRNA---protein transferase
MIFHIPEEHIFPSPEFAEPSGLLGIGGDLHPDRLLMALREGIFPWYSDGQPILWFSPNPRFVLDPNELHVPKSLKKKIRKAQYQIKMDTDFIQVIERCSVIKRPGQSGTWITKEMVQAYYRLHQMGLAHSVEAWDGEEMVGGLYGVSIGGFFDGESMFSAQPDASKIAFIWLARQLLKWGVSLIDCQVHTHHLERFGAYEIPRKEYIQRIRRLGQSSITKEGKWSFDDGFFPL